MPILTYPTPPPYPKGCSGCIISKCITIYGPEENGIRMPIDWVWSCRELNKVVQDFNECPIRELGFFQRQELFEKYNHTQEEG